MKTVIIDRNVLMPYDDVTATYIDFDDVIGDVLPAVGEKVVVVEIHGGERGPGRILSIDNEDHVIYVDVEWALLGLKDHA